MLQALKTCSEDEQPWPFPTYSTVSLCSTDANREHFHHTEFGSVYLHSSQPLPKLDCCEHMIHWATCLRNVSWNIWKRERCLNKTSCCWGRVHLNSRQSLSFSHFPLTVSGVQVLYEEEVVHSECLLCALWLIQTIEDIVRDATCQCCKQPKQYSTDLCYIILGGNQKYLHIRYIWGSVGPLSLAVIEWNWIVSTVLLLSNRLTACCSLLVMTSIL